MQGWEACPLATPARPANPSWPRRYDRSASRATRTTTAQVEKATGLPPGRGSPHRLEQECDLNRLLLRDLDRFPDVAAKVRDEAIRRAYLAATQWLAASKEQA